MRAAIKEIFDRLHIECLVSILHNGVKVYVLEKDIDNFKNRFSKPFDVSEYLATLIYNDDSIPSGARINIEILPEPKPFKITIQRSYNGEK